MHQPSIDRRSFLKFAAANAALAVGGAATAAHAARVLQPVGSNSKLNVGFIGVGGMGGADLRQVTRHPGVVPVGLCDVDSKRLADAAANHPDARTFTDWREMFDALGDRVDAIVVSTPDHTHAPAAMTGLNRNKHVYCQKPLTHDVYEARQLAKVAAEKPNLSTQMGTQFTARVGKRQAIALMQDPDLREKTIGRVVAIYGWSDRPAGWWPQGIGRPDHTDPVPDKLAWDLWIGTAPYREYAEGMYAPFNWRGCYDFGCGALGDMACHILDVPYYGLDLGYGKSVTNHNETATGDRFPLQQQVVTLFPGNEASGGQDIPLYWLDGGVRPHYMEMRVAEDFDVTSNACVIVGERGSVHIPHPEGTPRLFVQRDKPDQPRGTATFVEEDITGLLESFDERNHYHHWVDVALGKEKETQCRFQVSGPMTEALCLGAISARFPHETLNWNAESMKFDAKPEADKLVRREYRDGFKVENL